MCFCALVIKIFESKLIPYRYSSFFVLVGATPFKKPKAGVILNWNGILGWIVFQESTHCLTESDFWYDVIF